MKKHVLLLFPVLLSFCLLFSQEVRELSSEFMKKKKPGGTWTAAWSPDDKWIAHGGDDSLLWILEPASLKPIKVYQLPEMVRCISWHPAGKMLAISTRDTLVYLLEVESGQTKTLQKVTHGARGLKWNRNGQLLAAADNGGNVVIWNSEGIHLRTIGKENIHSYGAIDWHPRKEIIAAVGDEIRLFDTSGKALQVIKHRPQNIFILTVSWHPSGRFFAVGDYGETKSGKMASLVQFRNEEGRLLRTLSSSKAEYRNIRWNREGTLLATASDALRVWSAEGKLLHTGKSGSNLWGLSWDSEGKRIVTSNFGADLKLWTNDAKLLRK